MGAACRGAEETSAGRGAEWNAPEGEGGATEWDAAKGKSQTEEPGWDRDRE